MDEKDKIIENLAKELDYRFDCPQINEAQDWCNADCQKQKGFKTWKCWVMWARHKNEGGIKVSF